MYLKLKKARYCIWMSLFLMVMTLSGCSSTGNHLADQVLDKVADQVADQVTEQLNDSINQALDDSQEYSSTQDSRESKDIGSDGVIVWDLDDELKSWETSTINDLGFSEDEVILVDGGNRDGDREDSVRVDIGYGNREYWAFTNEYGQLVAVVAAKVILQDDEEEDVLSSGRYYSDEASVAGTQSSELDQGHVLADSLGGVSNAYNITPQASELNRHGQQADMEKAIREAGGASKFVAKITYPNTQTQIPTNYSFTYTLNDGQEVEKSFANGDFDEEKIAQVDQEIRLAEAN